MTFLFHSIASGEFTYISAPNLYNAIQILEKHYQISEQEKYHIFVRIV